MILSHIPLGRTFSVASAEGDQTDDDVARYLSRRQGRFQDWDWLQASPLAVILNEAGAGKTAEILGRIQSLRATGAQAFFLRLERLYREGGEAAFDTRRAGGALHPLAGNPFDAAYKP